MGSEVLGDDVACFEVELLDYGKKNHNPNYFGQYWNHYSTQLLNSFGKIMDFFFFWEFLQKLDSGYPSTFNIIKLKKKNDGSLERSELK